MSRYSELIEICCEYDKSFEQLFPECELLNEYITHGRYPDDLPIENIGEKQAIEAAEKVKDHVTRSLYFLFIPNQENGDLDENND